MCERREWLHSVTEVNGRPTRIDGCSNSSKQENLGFLFPHPMKLDRKMMKWAKTRTLEAIPEKLQCPESTVAERVAQLGLSIKGRTIRP
jgi:hypothetical protein